MIELLNIHHPNQRDHMTIRTISIKLTKSDPVISRRLQVPDQMTLADLHLLIQTAMPWDNCHLYNFNCNGKYWREQNEELMTELDDALNYPVEQWSIADFLNHTNAKKFNYVYDYGDYWEHKISVGAIVKPKPDQIYPKLVAAKEFCPPDDIGGIWQYNQCLKILKDPKHQDYEDVIEWFPEDFDTTNDVFPSLESQVNEFAKMYQ